jgi:hypothetical protein
MMGKVRCVGTGLSAGEHQHRTVANFLHLVSEWPGYSDRRCPFIPTLQGDTTEAMLRCYQMYLDAGVLLGEDFPLAGVGSVHWLQKSGQLADTARVLGQLGVQLHWFGLKLTGLRYPEIQRDACSPYALGGTQSLDSATWALEARHNPRLPGCTHVNRDTGESSPCNNCPRYAAAYAARVTVKLAAAQESPALLQGGLFTDLDLRDPGPSRWSPTAPVTLIIACSAAWDAQPAADQDPCADDMFRHTLAAARADAAYCLENGLPARILILSALHGLTELDEVLEPYDVTIGDPRSVTAAEIAGQATRLGMIGNQVYAFLPRDHFGLLDEALRPLLTCPHDVYEGARGIADQWRINCAVIGQPPDGVQDELFTDLDLDLPDPASVA